MRRYKRYICIAALVLCGCTSSPAQTQTEMTTTLVTTETETETSPPTETTTVTTTETTTEYVREYPEFEDTPENAYERLKIAFTHADGSETAPDDYAGVYSYFGKMYVCITTDEPSYFYTKLLGDYTCLTYKTVTHSFNELTNAAKRAAELLSDNWKVKDYVVDVPSNKAQVVVAEGDPIEMRTYLKEKGFTIDLIEITIEEDI
ncbi:MAG: hypothetical protein IKR73_09220 [Oscillospiraceae bacterium]|nr:hypothetical protein [Oscillospiraceae bacterium]